jgi:hypothetical protein
MNAKLEAKDGTISRLQQQIARLQGKPPHAVWVPGSAPAASLSDQSASGWSSSEKPFLPFFPPFSYCSLVDSLLLPLLS